MSVRVEYNWRGGIGYIRQVRLTLAALDRHTEDGIGQPRSSGGLLNDEGIPM